MIHDRLDRQYIAEARAIEMDAEVEASNWEDIEFLTTSPFYVR